MITNDKTSLGGDHHHFDRTPWSQIQRIQQGQSQPGLDEQLIRSYWKPVYCFLRRKGFDNELAKDLVQGFLQEVILEGDLVLRADAQQGRFRTLLLTALNQYLQREYRKQTAQKRQPKGGVMSLESLEGQQWQAIATLTPEEAFHYAWASTLLEEVLSQLSCEYRACGKEAHWQVFEQRVVQPILTEAPAPGLEVLCERYGLRDTAQASNMIVTVKRRFQSLLKQRLAGWAGPEADVEREINDLIGILSRPHAG